MFSLYGTLNRLETCSIDLIGFEGKQNQMEIDVSRTCLVGTSNLPHILRKCGKKNRHLNLDRVRASIMGPSQQVK